MYLYICFIAYEVVRNITKLKDPQLLGSFLIYRIMENKKLNPDDKQRFRGSIKIKPEIFERYKDRAEKEFIIKSLSELPIERLKKLVSFESINPFDNSISKSMEDEEYRWRLRKERVIEFRIEILI